MRIGKCRWCGKEIKPLPDEYIDSTAKLHNDCNWEMDQLSDLSAVSHNGIPPEDRYYYLTKEYHKLWEDELITFKMYDRITEALQPLNRSGMIDIYHDPYNDFELGLFNKYDGYLKILKDITQEHNIMITNY